MLKVLTRCPAASSGRAHDGQVEDGFLGRVGQPFLEQLYHPSSPFLAMAVRRTNSFSQLMGAKELDASDGKRPILSITSMGFSPGEGIYCDAAVAIKISNRQLPGIERSLPRPHLTH